MMWSDRDIKTRAARYLDIISDSTDQFMFVHVCEHGHPMTPLGIARHTSTVTATVHAMWTQRPNADSVVVIADTRRAPGGEAWAIKHGDPSVPHLTAVSLVFVTDNDSYGVHYDYQRHDDGAIVWADDIDGPHLCDEDYSPMVRLIREGMNR